MPIGSHTILPGFLLLQLKRIGDAVLTAPALAALRAAYPDTTLTLVLSGAAGALAGLFGMVDEVLVWQPGRLNPGLLHRVRELGADVVLDYTGTDRSAFLSLLSGAPLRVGYEKFASGWLRRWAWPFRSGASVQAWHTIDFHHALASPLGLTLPPVGDAGHLKLPATMELPSLPAPYILIHPGTAREDKFWPPEHWIALLQHLHGQHGLPIVLTGGDWAYERHHIRQILAGSPVPVTDLRGQLNLAAWAGVIAGARLAITVDTAAMHVAAAFEVPQLGLFGPTNPYHWAPRHPQSIIRRAGVPDGLSLQPKQRGAAMPLLPWQSVAAAADILLTPPAH